MRIVEKSEIRLVIKFGVWIVNRIQCTLDKTSQEFIVDRTVFFFKSKPRVYALSDLVNIRLFKVEGSAGEAGKFETTFPIIEFTSGRTQQLASGTGVDSEKVVAAMNEFLGRTP